MRVGILGSGLMGGKLGTMHADDTALEVGPALAYRFERFEE